MFTTPGPINDPFVSLYSSNGHHDISAVVCSHYQYAKNLPAGKRSWALTSRFPVQEIGINKTGLHVQHESIALWSTDMDLSKELESIVDRVPSPHSYGPRFSSFSQYSINNSSTVFDSLQKALKMRSTVQTAESPLTTINTSTALDTETTIPLLPSSFEPTPSTPSTPSTPLPLKDRVTLTLAQAMATARNASHSISPQSLAQDSIRGFPRGSLSPSNCIITFKPVGLTAFDVVLIAKIVHDYAPMYGLFDNQCYMFARVIFDAVVQLFSLHPPALQNNHTSTSIHNTPIPAPSQEVNLPANANVVVLPSPDQAGRWAGFLIVDPIVRSTIVSIVVARYNVERPLYDV